MNNRFESTPYGLRVWVIFESIWRSEMVMATTMEMTMATMKEMAQTMVTSAGTNGEDGCYSDSDGSCSGTVAHFPDGTRI